jgi:hypothetical protein
MSSIFECADTLLARRWRVIALDGEASVFVLDSAGQVLLRIPPGMVKLALQHEFPSDQSIKIVLTRLSSCLSYQKVDAPSSGQTTIC